MPSSGLGHVGPYATDRRRRLCGDREEQGRRGPAVEWQTAGQHLVERHAERPDVGARADVETRRLLGRHVGSGPDRGAGRGHSRDRLLGFRDHFGQPEIDDPHLSVMRQHDVRGFEVAMDDARGVRGGQPGGDLARDARRVVDGERPVLDALAKRLAVVERHRDEQLAVPLADVVHRGDVGVVEGAGGLRLAEKAGARVRVLRDRRRQEFQRDLAMQALVFGKIDDAHPTGADGCENPVVERLTCRPSGGQCSRVLRGLLQ
jgi:hypothetical protein